MAESMGYSNWFEKDENGHCIVEVVGTFNVDFSFGFVFPDLIVDDRLLPIFEFEHISDEHDAITVYVICKHAFIISIASYLCSMIISRTLAIKKGFSVDGNQEMLGLGIANAGCLVFGKFPMSGILASSIFTAHSSAKTSLWSIVCGFTTLLLSQVPICSVLLAKLPKAVLGAIVIETVVPLISFESVIGIGNVLKLDLWQYAVTMCVGLFCGIEVGIMAGMVAAVFEMTYRGTRNRCVELGRLDYDGDGTKFRKVSNHPTALITERILICRVYESLHFNNWYPTQQSIESLMREHELRCAANQCGDHLLGVVINLISCGNADSTAAFGLLDFSKLCARKGVAVRFSEVNDSVLTKLKNVGIEKIHCCGLKYKFYEHDFDAVVDIIEHHPGIHRSGSVHLSEAVSPSKSLSLH